MCPNILCPDLPARPSDHFASIATAPDLPALHSSRPESPATGSPIELVILDASFQTQVDVVVLQLPALIVVTYLQLLAVVVAFQILSSVFQDPWSESVPPFQADGVLTECQ